MTTDNKPNMFGRKRARRLALQGIYQWEMTKLPVEEVEAWLLENNTIKNIDLLYFKELIEKVPALVEELDGQMKPYLDRPQDQLELVELATLRIAVYELLHRVDIPYKVVINEALELAKTFGSVEGFKYVNAVLDKVAKDVRKYES